MTKKNRWIKIKWRRGEFSVILTAYPGDHRLFMSVMRGVNSLTTVEVPWHVGHLKRDDLIAKLVNADGLLASCGEREPRR